MNVGSATSPGPLTGAIGGSGTLDREAFLRLLVTQLKSQSPLDPVNNEDFVAQLAQFSQLETSQSMNEQMGSMLDLNRLTQGASLVGRRVTYLDPQSGEKLPGTVSAVEVKNGQVMVDLGGTQIPLQNILRVDASASGQQS